MSESLYQDYLARTFQADLPGRKSRERVRFEHTGDLPKNLLDAVQSPVRPWISVT